MLASELVKVLVDEIAVHGDKEVRLRDEDTGALLGVSRVRSVVSTRQGMSLCLVLLEGEEWPGDGRDVNDLTFTRVVWP